MANGFDKHAQNKGTSKGKIILMIGLAAVLGAVVFFHFKNAPQEALAGSPADAPAADDTSANPSQQIALLQQNPLTGLLTRRQQGDQAATTAVNPFAISGKWLAVLIKSPDPHPGPEIHPVADPHPNPTPLPPLNLDAVRQTLKLQGIFKDKGNNLAILNNKTVTAGTMVGKVQILEILDDHILCEVPGYGEAGRFEVSLNP